MTPITRVVERATRQVHRGRELIVVLRPQVIELRRKGAREGALAVRYDDLYDMLAWREARRVTRMERRRP